MLCWKLLISNKSRMKRNLWISIEGQVNEMEKENVAEVEIRIEIGIEKGVGLATEGAPVRETEIRGIAEARTSVAAEVAAEEEGAETGRKIGEGADPEATDGPVAVPEIDLVKEELKLGSDHRLDVEVL